MVVMGGYEANLGREKSSWSGVLEIPMENKYLGRLKISHPKQGYE